MARVAVAFLVLLLAGCSASTPSSTTTPPPAPATATYEVACHVVDEAGSPLAAASCHYAFPGLNATVPVDAEGVARAEVAEGATGEVAASAAQRISQAVQITVDQALSVRMVLVAVATSTTTSATDNPTTAPVSVAPTVTPTATVTRRAWGDPVTVVGSGSGAEPHLAMDSEGTIYYSPVNDLYRSTDDGETFQRVSPDIVEALPVLGGDTAVQVAPDGSVWWSRYWGYAGGTIGCTSTNKGDTWTCDNAALPGVTDRMWIAGKDATTGYVMTNEGLYHHVWAQTITGSLKYTPYATATTLLAVRNGNMVYDEVHDAFWQIEWTGGSQKLLRVDGALGLVPSRDTGVTNTYALPWLSVYNGTLWTTGEPAESDGSRTVVAARSVDGGSSWEEFPIQSEAKSVTFSYIAAGPDGRVALVYYGSDETGPSTSNSGVWSLYVAETDNALAEQPVWVETKVIPDIHTGNLCIGLNCETSGGDLNARFAGDLIGAWIGPTGDAHLAYVHDVNGSFQARYVRQHVV